MASHNLSILHNLRLAQIGSMIRRILGLPYLKSDDFLPLVSQAEQTRLQSLAGTAKGEGPAPVLVLGILPRSGTNYLRDLIALHPDVYGDPGRLYEFPLLQSGKSAKAFMDDFIQRFPRNAEVVGRWDALALTAGAWMRVLQVDAGPQHILLKSPHVEGLSLAPHVFPNAKIVLCIRDGRDIIDSSLKTFSRWNLRGKNFAQLAQSWRLGAEAILAFDEGGPLAHPNVKIVRYEDLVADTNAELTRVFVHLELDPNKCDMAAVDKMLVRGSSRATVTGDARWRGAEKSADFSPLGRWKAWPEQRKAKFRKIVGPVLTKAGYDAQ
ncbi:MAG: protein-tyrosine sulfotransferase [Ascidiaceihabitans sp.]